MNQIIRKSLQTVLKLLTQALVTSSEWVKLSRSSCETKSFLCSGNLLLRFKGESCLFCPFITSDFMHFAFAFKPASKSSSTQCCSCGRLWTKTRFLVCTPANDQQSFLESFAAFVPINFDEANHDEIYVDVFKSFRRKRDAVKNDSVECIRIWLIWTTQSRTLRIECNR